MTTSSLAFALAKSDNHEPIALSVDKLLGNREWGDADFSQNCIYYGEDVSQILAICDHFDEKRRVGLMLALDAHRLIRLLTRTDGQLRIVVCGLLRQAAANLIAGGLEEPGYLILKMIK